MGRKLEVAAFAILVLLFVGGSQANEEGEEITREGKVLSIFNIIKFPNEPCIGTGSKNGTCYTADECTTRGGTNAGACAQGYGVCCSFSVNCGSTSSENCTYFESKGGEIGQCKVEICPCSHDICQLRLDFNQFIITGPSTATESVHKTIFGEVSTGATGVPVALASRCLTDTFSVTNPTGGTPSPICGINSGEHMYIDSSDACNDLAFQLGQTAFGTGVSQRQWSIKVTQYACDYPNLAPDGCTQYFFGSSGQSVKTYNFDGGQHLANQDQNICIRRERGNCRICWTTELDTDFQVSGTSGTTVVYAAGTKKCCSYGTTGLATTGPDCLLIPGALKTATTTILSGSQICGRNLGIGGIAATKAGTVCSLRTPFNIRFLSDSFEWGDAITEAVKLNKGFKLTYIQNSQNC